ncbi:IS110 family transposase [Nocardia sp. NPDC004260]
MRSVGVTGWSVTPWTRISRCWSDRDRTRPVGGRPGRRRVHGTCLESVAGVPVSRTPGVSGAKSDAGDAHVLADIVPHPCTRIAVCGWRSARVEAVKVVTRMDKTMIWERTRHIQRLRHALRDYFPAALAAFEDLEAADTLELLAKAPTPAQAARLTIARSAPS